MSRGPYPILLILAMSLPGAAKALGLGDIRVDSALNEPLSAQIDIVGATREELVELTAKVANREMFQRYGADRPSFLATATFKVGLDSQGRPVLNVRSAEAFTDPVINFLVDLRWGKGELIREYSLLLDPAGFSSAPRMAQIAVVDRTGLAATPTVAETPTVSDPARLPAAASSPTVVSLPEAVSSSTVASSRAAASLPAASTTQTDSARGNASSTAPIASQHRVVARDTLRAIARRAGAGTESQAQRMMIAIYRANPHAFEGNINILHLGALLSIPSAQDLAAIDGADAKREVRAQMTAWRLDGRPAAPQGVAAVTPASSAHGTVAAQATSEPAQPHAAAAAADSAEAAATAALKDRVQSLEKALEEVHQQLATENAKIQDLKRMSAQEAEPATATEAPTGSPVQVERMRAEEHPAPVLAAMAPSPGQPAIGKGLLGSMAVGLALVLGGFAYFRRRIAQADAASPLPAEEPPHTSGIVRREATPLQPESTTAAKAAPVSRVHERPPPVTADAIIAREIHPRTESDDIDENMGIDTVALEKSYIDSLGDTFGIDDTAPHKAVEAAAAPGTPAQAGAAHASDNAETGTHDAVEMNTVVLDVSELDTAVIKADLNTAILETRKADPASTNNTVLDYNLLDLDATTQHVHMPSDLLDQPVVKDRRTHIVDALKMAIERDPERRDLRMKLLETYFSAASTNQRGFLEVVRKLSREPNYLSADDWQKVVMMGRAIAPDDILFTDQAKDDDLANCA
ncbi:MAG TPA: FimV/HubP family polar landmark protein [Steroidobacteraceae bacterium]|nr:FimV/HubP family polar landmark protein [Steroidobacteraceae bacterium]